MDTQMLKVLCQVFCWVHHIEGTHPLQAGARGKSIERVTGSDEQAIELANATEFGLIAYVYSSDLKRAMKVAESLESGMVAINKGVISDPAAPFGGFKQSGLGREGGFAGMEEFLESKYIGVEI